MNIWGVAFMSLYQEILKQTRDDKLLREFIRKIRHCGNHGNSMNIGMMTTVIDIYKNKYSDPIG